MLPLLPLLAIAGSAIQGVAGFAAGQSNKRNLYAQGAEEMRASQEGEREVRKDARRAIGGQLAAQHSNGMIGGTGTALSALRESQIEAVLDAREIRRQGVSRNAALRARGKQEEMQGYFSLASGFFGAASAASGQSHDWAQANSGSYG